MIGAIILGLVAGFVARALMPGKDDMGILATLALGLVGSLVGFYLFYAIGIGDNEMFDLGGLIGAIVGTMLVLWAYNRFIRDRGSSQPGAGRPVTH